MSTESDDIRFEEVNYRAPRRLRRPDRDRRFACLAYGTPGPEDLAIFIDRRTVDAIERHALSDTSVELGGILLGVECVDVETGKPFVWVSESIEAKHYENTQASFTYTHDSWEEITRERDEKHPGLDIVGWYHTHPNFGIFLSGHDVFIQKHFFGQPLQIAYVIDPVRQTRGFFQWRDQSLRQVEGYTIVADRSQRQALARTVNDLEGVLNIESGGGLGALPPRLESELIAMLNRPQTVSSPADRGQFLSTVGLVGLVAGASLVGLVLWIATLAGQVREQTETLSSLRAELAERNEGLPTAESAARVQGKEQALDALLAEVRVGDSNERFMDAFRRLTEERDRAIAEATLVEQVARDLIAKDRALARLRDQIKEYDRTLSEMEELRREAVALREANAELIAQARATERGVIERDEEQEPDAASRQYRIVWYAAVGGWGSAVLLGLALGALFVRGWFGRRKGASESHPPPDPGTSMEGPHEIR